MSSEYLVEVEHLKQYFPIRTGFASTTPLKAVDDVSFAIKPGETLGLVGESGCGKTTVGRSLLQLYQPTGGRIKYNGEVIFDAGDLDDNGEPQLDAKGNPTGVSSAIRFISETNAGTLGTYLRAPMLICRITGAFSCRAASSTAPSDSRLHTLNAPTMYLSRAACSSSCFTVFNAILSPSKHQRPPVPVFSNLLPIENVFCFSAHIRKRFLSLRTARWTWGDTPSGSHPRMFRTDSPRSRGASS